MKYVCISRMLTNRVFVTAFILVFSFGISYSQDAVSQKRIKARVCNDSGNPLGYTHIINLSSGRGTTSDSSGNFSLNVFQGDSIIFRNVSCDELIMAADVINSGDTIFLKTRLYAIREVKIFEWGSTYADFKAKMKSMPVTISMSEKLGLPQQSGNAVPNFRNADVLGNPMFAITNPIDFLYYNLNKNEQSIRKVMEFKQNEDLIRRFESVYNRKKVGALTGISATELDDFMIYLNTHFRCDFNCTEIQIVTEIFEHWKNFQKQLQ